MKEVELRLGLVLYGGVSLAIYMHGVSREILNLVRASSYRLERKSNSNSRNKPPEELGPTQTAYQDLLDLLAPVADVRVVVDAIAGASAGGVNGIMLGRALAHDLPLDSHSEMWLENADVTRLARPQSGLSRYFKMSVSPVLDRLVSARLSRRIESPETQDKLRQFMQSRWFSPPFSGERFIGWMLDASLKMEVQRDAERTLIPRGQTLDLFVTITDYNGVKRRILLDDPDFVEEWDHRRILNFHAAHRSPHYVDSQFDARCIPELVFAARATSSFPGAFPPATVAEMERVLARRDEKWLNKDQFLAKCLRLSDETMARHCFVDGSVVMNKPFAPVIDVIKDRPAAREVARRLIYVDPTPLEQAPDDQRSTELPGFFRVILASLAHIPRNEPIGDDLKELEQNNRRSRWLSQLVDTAAPMVQEAVSGFLPKRRAITAEIVANCRRQATATAFEQAGFAFLNYQSLKLHALAERLAKLVSGLGGTDEASRQEEGLLTLFYERFSGIAAASADQLGRTDPAVIALLRGLDVDYRIRRLRFVIRKLNGFYNYDPSSDLPPPDTEELDRLKGLLYDQVDHLTWRWQDRFYGGRSQELAEELCAGGLTTDSREAAVRRFLDGMTQMMGLADLDRLQDELFAEAAAGSLDKERHTALLEAYIGFGFYDLITFPVLQRNDFSEVTEILVDRISPRDAESLYTEGFELKGKQLNTFGAFFNRSWREHDYLWGRLNAADRLVSVVLSSIGDAPLPQPEVNQARARIFLAILEEEREKLPEIQEEIERIDALIRSIYPDFAHVAEEV
ncbi:patatin-like protein [Roseibium sp.]|uniref:patatin-like protein n=1 Tax=Roseibium sp. TaxID=1936156 RepID=UPI003B52E33E